MHSPHESTPYRPYDDEDRRNVSYRGFSTSIAGSFRSLDQEGTDACSLVCCGILQTDRDRFILTGIRPPSCGRRLALHVLLPFCFFAVAADCAVSMPNGMLNEFVSTILVLMLILYFVLQCCKGSCKREAVRKQVLWRKYQIQKGNANPLPLDEDDDDEEDFYQGQSGWDMHCAHAFIGCYGRDTQLLERSSPKNILGCLWNSFSMTFCGFLGCHLQICGLCGIAQEAREVNVLLQNIKLDYVTFEPMMEYAPRLWLLRSSENASFWHHATTLSKLSKIVLVNMSLSVLAVAGLLWYLLGHWGHALVALGTFVYSFVFLACIHWVRHKFDVSIDALIKYFACGFFLASTMAVSWEIIIGLVLRGITSVVMAMSGVDVAIDEDGYGWPSVGFAAMNHKEYLLAFGRVHPFLYVIYLFVNAYILAALIEELSKYLGFRMLDHPDVWCQSDLDEAAAAGILVVDDEDDEDLESPPANEGPIEPSVSIEAPKRAITSVGAAITVSMVAVALGFACCENLIYIFIYNKQNSVPIEIAVLVIRGFFPIHPICAAIQSIGVCRRDLEMDASHQLGRIILPAVLVHGTFDFILMLCDFFDENGTSLGWEIVSIVASISIIVGATSYYFRESRAQRARFNRLEHQARVADGRLL